MGASMLRLVVMVVVVVVGLLQLLLLKGNGSWVHWELVGREVAR
jgi:hypothetical protein